MSSTRETFVAKTFAASSFNAQAWRGKPFVSCSGLITITRLVRVRQLDPTADPWITAAWFIGTMICDVQSGTYNGALWTVTNNTTRKTLDCDAASSQETAEIGATMVESNAGTGFSLSGYTFTNSTLDTAMACTSATPEEVADILANFYATWIGVTGGMSGWGAVVVAGYGPGAVRTAGYGPGTVRVEKP